MNEQLAFAGWTLAAGINNDGMHGRVDDLLPTERAIERMVVELEPDGAHGGNRTKKGFRFSFTATRIAGCLAERSIGIGDRDDETTHCVN